MTNPRVEAFKNNFWPNFFFPDPIVQETQMRTIRGLPSFLDERWTMMAALFLSKMMNMWPCPTLLECPIVANDLAAIP